MGVFERHGLDLQIVREETAGPEGARGLLDGDYQFAEFGTVPLVQACFDGGDPLILLAAEPRSAMYILSLKDIKEPQQLKGTRLGVLTLAGQTGHSARKMLDTWLLGDSVELLPFGTYPAIYQGMIDGELDAGVLTADYRIAGEMAYGFNALVNLGDELRFQGPILATTVRTRDSSPAVVQKVVDAYCDTLALFRRSDSVVPSLHRHLRFVTLEQTYAIREYYAKRFQSEPYPSLDGLARVIDSVRGAQGVSGVTPESMCDTTFLDRTLQKGRSK
ncbi:MAG: hypothetical protein CL536_05825 [Alcaligenaceae bacterium]|nr:hypothetical protein [Alcaligenaceae bacterium]